MQFILANAAARNLPPHAREMKIESKENKSSAHEC